MTVLPPAVGVSATAVSVVKKPAPEPVTGLRLAPLDRLPGTAGDDPFLRLAAGWLVGHPARTALA